MLKIVKDTGCINAKSRVDILNFIEEMEGQGKLKILMITTSAKEWKNYGIGHSKYLNTTRVGEYGRFDFSYFDQSDYGDRISKERSEIIARKLFHKPIEEIIINPKKNNLIDIMILNRAIGLNTDFFVTLDKNFVKNNNENWFERFFNIKIRYVEKKGKNIGLIKELKEELKRENNE